MQIRPAPIRTCVSCRTHGNKRELLRVVRLPDGSVIYDVKGKVSGRGAYVCADRDCISQARKQKRLERSLKVSALPDAVFDNLMMLAEKQEPSNLEGLNDPKEREKTDD